MSKGIFSKLAQQIGELEELGYSEETITLAISNPELIPALIAGSIMYESGLLTIQNIQTIDADIAKVNKLKREKRGFKAGTSSGVGSDVPLPVRKPISDGGEEKEKEPPPAYPLPVQPAPPPSEAGPKEPQKPRSRSNPPPLFMGDDWDAGDGGEEPIELKIPEPDIITGPEEESFSDFDEDVLDDPELESELKGHLENRGTPKDTAELIALAILAGSTIGLIIPQLMRGGKSKKEAEDTIHDIIKKVRDDEKRIPVDDPEQQARAQAQLKKLEEEERKAKQNDIIINRLISITHPAIDEDTAENRENVKMNIENTVFNIPDSAKSFNYVHYLRQSNANANYQRNLFNTTF
jgi:hypothetical protein